MGTKSFFFAVLRVPSAAGANKELQLQGAVAGKTQTAPDLPKTAASPHIKKNK